MLIFLSFSKHNLIIIFTKTHQTAPYFQNFLMRASICPYMSATLNNMYSYRKIAIFYSRLFQNTHQRFFSPPPPKVLEKKWTIVYVHFHVHFQRVCNPPLNF